MFIMHDLKAVMRLSMVDNFYLTVANEQQYMIMVCRLKLVNPFGNVT